MPMQTWRQMLYTGLADGTAVTAAAETILVPDYTVPAGFLYPGAILKYTLYGRISTVITTPGTWTWKLRWGGVGGTSLATTAAITPDVTAASTNVSWCMEFFMKCRTVGTSGTAMTWGKMMMADLEDASSTTLAAQLSTFVFPDANAAVTIDTTTAKALSPTITPSVATGSMTCHEWMLESLN